MLSFLHLRVRYYTVLQKITALLFFISLSCPVTAQPADPKELKKEADKRFDKEDYDGAYKLYSQLVANYPKDPVFNYRLGVCMIYSEPDKKKAIPYLKTAAASHGEAPKETQFYLGKAYHINYRFNEALQHYNNFKTEASSSLQKKLEVEKEIAACHNGKRLLSNMSDLEVQSKKILNQADYFRSYDLSAIGGKLLIKPEEFKTALDKKKKDRSVVYLPKKGEVLYFSSYGDRGDNGRDIYTVQRLSGGIFSKPQPLQGINTPYDEDYPFMHPDGKTLYFASKGHNSMGGYDIFKSVWDDNSQTWSTPVNLEFPINSPDDDFLFVTDSLEQVAFFSTGRQSSPGKIDVLKIKTRRRPIDVIMIAGSVEQSAESQSVESTITIKDAESGTVLGQHSAEASGDYSMDLPNGARLLFTVATPGFKTQTQEVQLPLAASSAVFGQKISYEKGNLIITNDFDPRPHEDNYERYLAVIEKKAKLDVNEGQNKLEMPLTAAIPGNNEDAPKPTVTDEQPADPPPAAVNNRQLAVMARQDADESTEQATQFEKEAEEAVAAAEKQKRLADEKLSEAAEELKTAENIADPGERTAAVTKAKNKLEKAKTEQKLADKVGELAGALEQDALHKKKLAGLNKAYADELDKIVVSGNVNSLKKLETLREEIETLTNAQTATETRRQEIKKNIGIKEEQLGLIEQQNNVLRLELAESKTAIESRQDALSRTRKKSKKTELSAEIDNLRAEQNEKEQELQGNEAEIVTIKEELRLLKKELNLPASLTEKEKEEELAAAKPQKEPETTEAPAGEAEKTNEPLADLPQNNASAKQDSLQQVIAKIKESLPSPLAVSATDFGDEAAKELADEALSILSQLNFEKDRLKAAIKTAENGSASKPASVSAEIVRLSSEADNLQQEADGLRSEARQAEGENKENKIKEARAKEELANDRLIELSALNARQSEEAFRTGEKNMELLLNAARGQKEISDEVKTLHRDARLAFKQAAEIRSEAEALSGKGAKLGNLSNAEEKEAEALLKQQRAIEILKEENPHIQLAVAETQLNGTNTLEIEQSAAKIAVLEKQYYAKTYEANEQELVFRSQNLKNPEPDFVAGLREEVIALKREADNTTSVQASNSTMSMALQKQQQLIRELEEIANNDSREEIAAAETPADEPEKLNEVTAPVEQVKPEEEPEAPVEKTREVPYKEAPVTENIDTSADDDIVPELPLTTYLGKRPPVFSNQQSADKFAAAFSVLDELSAEPGESPESLRDRSNDVFYEAEDLSARAQELKTAAAKQSGQQQAATLAAAQQKEDQSQQKMLESARLVKQANESEISNNNKAIEELTGRMKMDNTSGSETITALIAEIKLARTQLAELRQEADRLTNPAQRLGAMSNAEEKEAQVIQSQAELLTALKQFYPDYVLPTAKTPAAQSSALTPEKQQRKVQALTNLTNAINLEFELARKSLSANAANSGEQELRKKAFENNSASKQLLVEAMREPDAQKRTEILSQASRKSAEGLESLRKLVPAEGVAVVPRPEEKTPQPEPVVEKESEPEIREEAITADTRPDAVKTSTAGTTARVQGLEVIRGNAYNNNRPIPVNAPAGEGLLFRVQIGAFRQQLPNDAFKGLSPLNAESTAGGFYRYTAGNFNRIENANAVKNDLRSLGYSDAFVVAYFNGRRISLTEAMAMMEKEGRTIDKNAPATAGITANTNIPKPAAAAPAAPVRISDDLSRTNGLLYTIQIGVYNRQVTAQQLLNLSPVFSEDLGNGLFRYTAGIYNDPARLLNDKQKVIAHGIRDAFVTAYLNGKRISFAAAKEQQNVSPAIIEQPVVFPSTEPTQPVTEIQPFTNNVSTYPAPTAENGVKTNESGISYKVQIGAYSKQVPEETASLFAQIRNWPVEYKQVNNLFIYNIGNFSEARFARELKDEAVRLGLPDAFVTVYRDGKKLYGSEAAELLSR